MSKRLGYTIEKRGVVYDAYCERCNYVAKSWDWMRNARAHIRQHLLDEHHEAPGVSVHVSSDEDGLAVMVFGTENTLLARGLAVHALVHDHGYDADEMAQLVSGEPKRERGNIVPLFGYWLGEGYRWLWVGNDKGRSNPMIWEQD